MIYLKCFGSALLLVGAFMTLCFSMALSRDDARFLPGALSLPMWILGIDLYRSIGRK